MSYHDFLHDLTALTRKHGLAVGGCGCCDSPFLVLADEESRHRTGRGSTPYAQTLKWNETTRTYTFEEVVL